MDRSGESKRMRMGSAARFVFALFFFVVGAASSGCQEQDAVEQARTLQASAGFEASIEVLRTHLDSHPQDAEAQYLYGLALSQTVQPSRAQWPLREAMRDEDWLVPAGIVLARDALATGNYHSATQVADAILEHSPGLVDGLQLRASAAIMSRKAYDRALEDAEQIMDLEPDHPDAGVLRAVALLGLGRTEEAETQIHDALETRGEVHPDLAGTYCAGIVKFLMEKRDTEGAASQADRCLEDHPNHALVISTAIELHDGQQNVERSMEVLRKALEAMPRSLDLRQALARRLHGLNRGDEAEALLVEATRFEPAAFATEARLELFDFYRAIGEPDKAADQLKTVVDVLGSAAPPQMQFALADTLISSGRLDEALSVAENMTNAAHRAFTEGQVALFREDPERALERLSEGYKTWPDNATARYYGGYAAEQLGRIERAIEEYRYSIRAGAGETDARYRLARLFHLEGNDTTAFETLLTDLQNSPLRPDGLRLSVELGARLGRFDVVRSQIARLADAPIERAAAVAAAARGLSGVRGPAAAAQLIEEMGIDPRDARDLEALRVLVVMHANADDFEAAGGYLETALAATPRSASLHELRGFLLEHFSANVEMAREAYQRAVSLNPNEARALAGLARLRMRAGDAEEGRELLAQAHEADPEDAGIALSYATALIDAGGEEEIAHAILDGILEADPLDARAALALAELRKKRSEADEVACELAKRAARFGAGAPAFELVARCAQARGDREAAEDAERRAAALRSLEEEASKGVAPAPVPSPPAG